MTVNSGIYFIINLINGKYYIGSSINLVKRWNEHQRDLIDDKHGNILLQRAYNKYGLDAFQFTIVELIEDTSKLLEIEQLWIDASNCCNRSIGYNLSPTAGSNLGFKFSEDSKIKMSAWQRGRKLSEETKLKISNSHKGKAISDKVREIFKEANKNRRGNNHHRRKNDKWPCDLGIKCKCENCMKEKSKLSYFYYTERIKRNTVETRQDV